MSTTTASRTEDGLKTPPLVPGLPLLGNALEFWRDPVALFRRGYELFGPMFAIKLGPKYAAVLLGPECNRFFFSETDRLLSMRQAYQFVIPMFGDKLLFVAEQDEYREQRAILLPAFSGHSIDGYVTAMVREVTDWLDTLGDEGQFELVQCFGNIATFNVIRAFLGDEYRAQAGTEFWRLFRDVAGGIEYLLPTNLPLPRFIRRDRAKAQLQRLLGQMMAQRRASGQQHHDLLQMLLEARYSNGEPLPDHLIVNLIVGLVFAGSETTQGCASWSLVQLLQHPTYLARVLAEQAQVFGDDSEISSAALKQLTQLDWAVKETERMRPILRVIPRVTVKAYELKGYHVPRGWMTIASPAVSQSLPDVFPDPERYDPDRFAPPRSEDQGVPFSLIGFGGGLHRCIGMYLAYTEIKVLLTLLLRHFDLSLVDPDPTPVSGARVNHVEAPCYIRYRRRQALQSEVPATQLGAP
jgi:sterol 14-demethylase